MSLFITNCSACGKHPPNVETLVDEKGEFFLCMFKRVDVYREPGAGARLGEPQPPPKMGEAPPSWSLVIIDMHERDRTGAAKYGVRHQFDNGRDHLVDAYQESLDQTVYLRAEIEKRRRMRELARVLRDPQNSSPLAELIDLVEAGS